MDEYPPPDDRWIRIGRNAYSLPWSKMTKEEKQKNHETARNIRIRKEIKSIWYDWQYKLSN